jgi:hypothetical protein
MDTAARIVEMVRISRFIIDNILSTQEPENMCFHGIMKGDF